jgi:hypothetical protein
VRTLLRVLRESASCGGEKQVELVDCVLASRTNQQMVLKELTLARGHPLQRVYFGDFFDGRNISGAG